MNSVWRATSTKMYLSIGGAMPLWIVLILSSGTNAATSRLFTGARGPENHPIVGPRFG